MTERVQGSSEVIVIPLSARKGILQSYVAWDAATNSPATLEQYVSFKLPEAASTFGIEPLQGPNMIIDPNQLSVKQERSLVLARLDQELKAAYANERDRDVVDNGGITMTELKILSIGEIEDNGRASPVIISRKLLGMNKVIQDTRNGRLVFSG
jgi:hypothetical protein